MHFYASRQAGMAFSVQLMQKNTETGVSSYRIESNTFALLRLAINSSANIKQSFAFALLGARDSFVYNLITQLQIQFYLKTRAKMKSSNNSKNSQNERATNIANGLLGKCGEARKRMRNFMQIYWL